MLPCCLLCSHSVGGTSTSILTWHFAYKSLANHTQCAHACVYNYITTHTPLPTTRLNTSREVYLCSWQECKVGQNHIYAVYIKYFWQGNRRGGRRRPEIEVLLKCELSMGAPAGNNQAQYPEVLLIALELECCQLGRTRLILRDVNPIFNHHYLIPHHPLTWFVSFLYESSTFQ